MEIKVIALVGDSHTWGEGVGAERSFVPAVCCGDLRPLSLEAPCYAGLLRAWVNRETGSSFSEYEGAALSALCGGEVDAFGAAVTEGLVIREDFDLARVFFRGDAEEAEAEVVAVSEEGEVCSRISLQSDTAALNECIQVTHVRAPRGETAGRLLIRSPGGKRLAVMRVELYRGAYAVVNCGIGSCPVGKYTQRYFARYVTALSPHAIVFEGCTINDWLCTPTAGDYGTALRRMLADQRALTPRVLWHTVTPILGSQTSRPGSVYGDYVEAMREVAAAEGVETVDCNREMGRILAALPEEERAGYFFHDPWHPNREGHRMYAEMILPHLRGLL